MNNRRTTRTLPALGLLVIPGPLLLLLLGHAGFLFPFCAVLFGAFRRLVREQRARDSVWLGAGMLILANFSCPSFQSRRSLMVSRR